MAPYIKIGGHFLCCFFAPAAIDRIDDHRDSIVTRDIGSGAEAVLGEVERDHQAGHCAVSSNARSLAGRAAHS